MNISKAFKTTEYSAPRRRGWLVTLAVLCVLLSSTANAATCGNDGLALQVLGSGGPIADDSRASSGYLLWNQGKAVALIDAGGGVFQRFGAAGGNIDDLELIALTHFHTDHSADLPAILKGAFFSQRMRPLAITGPSGAQPFPSLEAFLDRLFGKQTGAFAYLSGLQGDGKDLPKLAATTVDANNTKPKTVFRNKHFSVQAVGIHHGPVPTLGYLITVGDKKIAISGDQNLTTDYFTKMISGADLFVMPTAAPESKKPVALHARPSDIGMAAKKAGVGKLVLSHWMARSLKDQDANLAIVKDHYAGPVVSAEDLQCLAL